MAQIIPGSVIGTYETTAITLGVSKNENNSGVKAPFAILTVKDEYSKGARPKKLIFFEGETISTEEIKIFGKYKSQQPDQQGGYPVSIQALKASEDWEMMKGWFSWPGANTEDYKLRKGLCYGNDIDGQRSIRKDGTPVITETISVFTQVKFFTPEGDGSLKPHYVAGLSLEEQGRRIEDRFYKVPVETVQIDATETPSTNNGAAEAPANEPPF